jgi:hypothetical protein
MLSSQFLPVSRYGCSSLVQAVPSRSSSSHCSAICRPTIGKSATHAGGPGGPSSSRTAIMLATLVTLSASPVPTAASGRMKIAATSSVISVAARVR